MRWLLLDAGNTALKWEVIPSSTTHWPGKSSSGVGQRWRGTIGIDSPELPAEIGRACAAASALTGTPTPSLIAGCAVTSRENMERIDAAVRGSGAPPVTWFGAEKQFDHDRIQVQNEYRDPGQLGADRWHALIGARARVGRGVLAVINAGTATTVDGLSAEGRFMGGTIAPGLELMRSSLAAGTARLPLAKGQYVALPDNTADAIHTGVLDAQIGYIERRIRRIREKAGGNVNLVIAGGNAAAIVAALEGESGFARLVHDPDVVLWGLWHRARANAAGALARPAK